MSRIRADKFVNSGANGAPQLTFGAEVVAGVGLTGAGGINITGVATAASFSGNLTGNATGLTGTPNITINNLVGVAATFTGNVSVGGTLTYEDVTNIDSVGIITARSDVSIADKIIHTGDTNTAIRFPAADTFTVETGGSEALRVDSAGKLLVGTISDASAGSANSLVQVVTDDGAHLILGRNDSSISAGDAIGFLRFFGNDGGSYQECAAIVGRADGTHANNDKPTRLEFKTTADGASSATERLRITSAGEVQIANGNLKFSTSGTGIDFSATNDPAGQTSELLDDYEEGTWTPTIGGNATYTNQVGTYVKVGRMGLAQWALTINAQGTGSNISAISGLPYPSGVASQVTSNLLWGGFGVSMAYAVYYVGNASTTMNLSYIATAATALTNNPNGLVNGATVNGTIVYYST